MANTLDGYTLNITYFEEGYEDISVYFDRNVYSLLDGYLITPPINIKRSFILHYSENTTWSSSATNNFKSKYASQTFISLSLDKPIILSVNVAISEMKVEEINNLRVVRLKLMEA
jgi:hypothetical protein